MKVIPCLYAPISQAEFAALIGVSEARVSQLVSEGVIVRGDSGHEWLLAYCERLRDQAAGRASAGLGGLDLVQERAALAWAESVTQIATTHAEDDVYLPLLDHFSAKEISDLTFAISLMNCFNRLAVGMRM